MAWSSVGFDGTITEIQWAGLAGLLGNDYVAAGNGDCLVTAVPGARSVSVAAGSLYGDGVLSTNSGAETVAMTTPVNGQWYVIALRRTWATNSAALVAIAGATTTTSTPAQVPTSYPTLNTDKGVLTDQPIAWAWCNSANVDVVVADLRSTPMKQGETMPTGAIMPFANTTAPTGWVSANGAAVSRLTYHKLFAAIGTTYGAGNGTTTFNLPDLRGRVAVGQNVGTFSTLGSTGGAETHTLSISEMPSHNHGGSTSTDGNHNHPFQSPQNGQDIRYHATVSGGNRDSLMSGGQGGLTNGDFVRAAGSHSHTISSQGGGGAHNNLQPYQTINYCVKY